MKLILYLLTALIICSCNGKQSTNLYDSGISQELAHLRKGNIKDLEYCLKFNIPPQKDSAVLGEIGIGFVVEKQQEIIIDYREEEGVISVEANGAPTTYMVQNEHIIIPAEAVKEGKNRINISFVAGNQSLNRREELLYTLLVPDRARTVFPCFDQPDLKGTFKLTLVVPEQWCAVSNSPVSSEKVEQGRREIVFSPTEPLSTYLFSFVAGIFKSETYNNGKHTFTAYHRETDPHRIAQLPTIFNQVATSLEWMEEYTGVPYPFAKYDFIILPGFQYGGMEHTGATLYNDTRMFLSKNPTPDEELGRAELIAHETAHMWFGDFVTMDWFNDVWTKEVFANYFAQRITGPMFPGINHRLNWLKSITTSALVEDRTLGGTSIRQPLDNMRNAGLVYNNIIYNKAPVMLEKLVELMGEEAFREGIHDYLVTYSYGNATWDDLVKILNNKTEADLISFSDVWVNSKGMPWIDFSIEGDSLVVNQSDPYNRGLCWPQSFKVAVIGKDAKEMWGRMKEIEVTLSGKMEVVPLDMEASYILPNCDGRGYGYFHYPAASLEWILENWFRIGNETCRQAQLMNLYEAFQHGEIDADTWLNSLITGLPYEKNALIASTVCSYIGVPLVEAGNSSVEIGLMEMAEAHPLKSCRQQLLRALISAASEESVCKRLYDIWAAANHPLLSGNDYMTLA